MAAMPLAWWLRPVTMHDRLGEHRAVVCMLLYRSPFAANASRLGVSIGLLAWVADRDAPLAFGVYLPSNWPVPFGIVLVLDRLSALMLVLTALVALTSLLFSLARWQRARTRNRRVSASMRGSMA